MKGVKDAMRRKRRQLKNKATGGTLSTLSSEAICIVLPLIIATIICCILVFGTFKRINQDAAQMSIQQSTTQVETQTDNVQ